jgi:hypothetical protein
LPSAASIRSIHSLPATIVSSQDGLNKAKPIASAASLCRKMVGFAACYPSDGLARAPRAGNIRRSFISPKKALQ